MQILTYVLIGLAVVLAAILIYASTRPDKFAIRRSARIAAPPERIFPLIADLRAMNTWNPFVEPDPAIEISYSGPESGQGAVHTWSGNRNVGEGRLTVTEATAPSSVVMRLEMAKPMKADNRVEFTLEPSGRETVVSWQMSGRQPLVGKLMTLFIDCDRMVGSQFEKGLGKLKAIAER
ncbi:MAG: SRPBCC family protein [Hyphomicrobiaceae bacterium]|nr:MAG: SRPBCC family protein [Hyphomicrobiaceae bacterium]